MAKLKAELSVFNQKLIVCGMWLAAAAARLAICEFCVWFLCFITRAPRFRAYVCERHARTRTKQQQMQQFVSTFLMRGRQLHFFSFVIIYIVLLTADLCILTTVFLEFLCELFCVNGL